MMKNFLEVAVFGGHPVYADPAIIMMASVELVVFTASEVAEATYHAASIRDVQNVGIMTNKQLLDEIAALAAIIGTITTI